MNRILLILTSILLVSWSASAQEPLPFQDPLLDHMIGNWVLRGAIAGSETTHDIDAQWVLGHQYVRFHEVSREKNAEGLALYEAIVFIGWDAPSSRYACLWLDSTGGGGLTPTAIAYAKRSGDEIAFLFTGSDGSIFHTTFVYSEATDTWRWLMDGEADGKLEPFARVKLTRK